MHSNFWLSITMGTSTNLRIIGFNSHLEMGSPDGKSAIELTDDSRAVPVSTTRNLASLKSSSEDFGTNYIWRIVFASIKTAFFSDKINFLLPCGPLAMLVDQLTQHHITVGSLLNATFGNATELIISLFAMKQGMLRLVQQSLLGSILSNMLLVLGCALFSGGIVHRNKEQIFNKDESLDDEESAEISKWESIIWLGILTLFISVLSEYLVNAIEGASVAMDVPVAFIGVVLLPVVGNAAEHASAIMFAVKDKLDIALGVAIGSSTQISMFVMPFCVVVGWMIGSPMDLNFQLFETAILFMTVLVVAFVLQFGDIKETAAIARRIINIDFGAVNWSGTIQQ
ncbi:hypothetical protein L2E82_37348 [Cichorium intybus]|uniref:Uncharacterized protein n=1 Tax=Cichorium intybus TaxID=13427 RepID=A0ACB9ADB0_CICIN|nr:hypothetical protein L2E82_37348 [Cichorium intybus]